MQKIRDKGYGEYVTRNGIDIKVTVSEGILNYNLKK